MIKSFLTPALPPRIDHAGFALKSMEGTNKSLLSSFLQEWLDTVTQKALPSPKMRGGGPGSTHHSLEKTSVQPWEVLSRPELGLPWWFSG